MLPVLNRHRDAMTTQDPFEWNVDRLFNRWLGESVWPAGYVGAYPVDIYEDDESVYVEAEMPGFKKEQINVTIEQGLLSITAERQPQTAEDGSKGHLRERRSSRYQRLFTLPTTVEDDKVEARLEDGVLHLRFPKAAQVKPRRISVK